MATALLVFVGVLVLRPLLVAEQRTVLPLSRRARLSAEKTALLAKIRALDFDYETNKLAEETYKRERLTLMQEAAERLRQLDRLGEENSVDIRIEAAVLALRDRDENSQMDSCPQCEKPIADDDKFCRACGEPLHVEA